MLRSVLAAVALASVLAAGQPVFADPVAPAASDHVQAATSAQEQSASPARVGAAVIDVTAPASVGRDKDAIPVGFGWG